MKNDLLQKFFYSLNNTEHSFNECKNKEIYFSEKISKLEDDIKTIIDNRFELKKINQESDLSKTILNLKNSLDDSFNSWNFEIKNMLELQSLSASFKNRIIFLVFGKVNAGKSSFINQIVEMYRYLFPKEHINHFCFLNGEVRALSSDHFEEGFIETTAQIQGVELGKYFVLLDSPGLGSVTSENEAITRKFIDSADAVLWLTPSDSPGQIDELNDLRIELEKEKPLVPVITRSDKYIRNKERSDKDKKIIAKDFINKTEENRKLQENDVYNRLLECNLVIDSLVKNPISISVLSYKKQGEIEEHLDEDYKTLCIYPEPITLKQCGLESLFNAMGDLITQSKEYKVKKSDNQVKIFFNKVIDSINVSLLPNVSRLKNEINDVLSSLDINKKNIENKIINYLLSKSYSIVNDNKNSKNKTAIVKLLSKELTLKLNEELNPIFDKFLTSINEIQVSLDANKIENFEDETIKYQVVKGSVGNTIAKSGGAVAGAITGGIFGGPLGALAGSFFGGYLGDKVVSKEYEYVTEIVGVKIDKLENSIQEEIEIQVPKLVSQSIQQVIDQLQPLSQVCEKLENAINDFIADVKR